MNPSAIEVQCPDCGNFHAPDPHPVFDDLLRNACAKLDEQVVRVYEDYRINAPGGRWDMDDDSATIRFSNADGTASEAAFGFVGTWEKRQQTFKWGWDHPSATAQNRAVADQVLAIGQQIDAPVLTTNMLRLDEDDVWHLAKIGAFLSEKPATYRVPAGENAWWYMAFDEPRWCTA